MFYSLKSIIALLFDNKGYPEEGYGKKDKVQMQHLIPVCMLLQEGFK